HAGTFSSPTTLTKSLDAEVKAAGVAMTEEEKTNNAEEAIRLLAELAKGNPAGYDITPAAKNILDALRAGKLSADGQKAAIAAAGKIPGGKTQAELAAVINDAKRPKEVRREAATALIRHLQKYGVQLTAQQAQPLRNLAKQDKLDEKLKGK